MKTNNKLIRPDHLETGSAYVLRELLPRERRIAWIPVCFTSYAACSGIVIVTNHAGRKMRVLRSELFCADQFLD
jgi:hypothetical protein